VYVIVSHLKKAMIGVGEDEKDLKDVMGEEQ
jgi:hypothetical protein